MFAAKTAKQTATPLTQDPTGLLYLRRHAWGEKLLRKLSPEDLIRFLNEKPFESDIPSLAPRTVDQENPESWHNSSNHNEAMHDGVKHILSKTFQRIPRTQYSLATAETHTSDNTSDNISNNTSDNVYQHDDSWIVPGVGSFSKKAEFSFTGNTLPAGLTASNNAEDQGSAPFSFRFDPGNVSVSGGTLNLKVPGGQDPSTQAVSCAEVTTDETTILHASVRMTAKMSAQQGVCHGAFFYRSDSAESDIEYLTDPASRSNRSDPNVTQFWYSNQAKYPGRSPTHESGDAPPAVEGYHTYRLDWTAKFTAYYVDGKLQSRLTHNVPDKSGMWVWNNWSNGDAGWSCGPPEEDSIFRIKDITMYYNTLS